MTDNSDDFLDAGSGISLDEQREILKRINAISEKNRRHLSQNESEVIPVKKRSIFPLAVNIAAFLILITGVLLLVSFNRRENIEARSGSAVFNLTEKALIDEIRRETSEKIALREKEINLISLRLKEVDTQLSVLQSGSGEMSEEQLSSRNMLLELQGSYLNELSMLNEERSQILEDSRSREERLRAALEERTRDLDTARHDYSNELERLTAEQTRIALIDMQFSGGIVLIRDMIKSGQYREAALAIDSLREFCNNNSLSSSATFQSRKAVYNQSLDLIEAVTFDLGAVNSAQGVNYAANNGGSKEEELLRINTRLEETIVSLQQTIDSINAGGSQQQQRLAQLNEAASALRSENASLSQDAAAKDRTISALRSEIENAVASNAGLASENTGLTSQINELRASGASQQQRITELENQLAAIRELLGN